MNVCAETVSEEEPNDITSQAQLIFANSESASGCVNGTYSGQYVVNGTISSYDTDWYMVWLSAGTKYVTSSGASFNYEIYEENDLIYPMYTNSYYNNGSGVSAQSFTVTTSGTYYVKLTGILTSSSSYTLAVGGPTYLVDDYYYYFGSIYMNGSNYVTPLYTVNETSIPNGAIVYRIIMGGITSTNVNGVDILNITGVYSCSLSGYNPSTNVSIYSNVPAKADWRFTFKYKKNITIYPSVTIKYVYPVTS
uniref:hypothetical protein n=1 Tax=Eubacterium cellulosolvens TaxID=29322 RepID=UPI000A9EC16C|nr:hypothetical protein [[Eubacterium] cellulosolvens]